MYFLFKKPYLYILIFIVLLYSVLLYFLSDFDTTFRTALLYSETVNWYKLGFSIFLSLVIAVLIGVNSCYLYRNYLLKKSCKDESTLVGAGVIGGIAVGICPLCVGGLFPIVLSLFGISFSFGSLPFQGLEVQVLVILLLGYGFIKLKGGLR